MVGLIPGVGQVADARDIAAALSNVAQGREGGWVGLGAAALAVIPSLDWVKGATRVGSRVAGEVAEEAAEEVAERVAREKFSEIDKASDEFEDFGSYWLRHNPQARIDQTIREYGLEKHLSGREVIYAGEKTGVAGGVHPLDPMTIKIYKEGISAGDRQLIETLIEEVHHSRLMRLYPQTKTPDFNETWNRVVEPRAKEYAREYADRLLRGKE